MGNVLLTFTGFHDPYSSDVVEDVREYGPVLTALGSREFSRVYLFVTPRTAAVSTETAAAIAEIYPEVTVETSYLDLIDPTDYRAILQGLRKEFGEIQRENRDADYHVATSSGTPQMHACWLLLVASGEFPATLLHTTPRRFIREGGTSVTEIDVTAGEFPVVRPPMFADSIDTETGIDLGSVVRTLDIVGDDPAFVKTLETAARLAESDIPVLITGESGTGKEKIAELVHTCSRRSKNPFRKLNCAAIPPTLAESMLFGHAKGAFTGATQEKKGEFELAHEGTLFLDEFGELPLEIQAKLLRVIEHGEVQPVGDRTVQRINVRLVVATNRNLAEEVAAGRFREDLFYRVDVGRIHLPPLRQRRDDIPKLVAHFVDNFGGSLMPRRTISPDALASMRSYSWPGNIRQLANTIQRAVFLCREGTVRVDDLQLGLSSESLPVLPDPYEGFEMQQYLETIRGQLQDRALELAGGNHTSAAKLLGISQQAVSEFEKKRTTR